MTPTVDGLKASDVAAMVPRAEGELYRLAVPWDVGKTNANARHSHWSGQRAAEREGKELALLFWRVDRYRAPGKVRVQFYVMRGRRLDDDNAMGGLQPVINGAFKAAHHNGEGITEDDDARYLEVECVRQIVLPQFRRAPWVVVVVKRGEE